MNQHIFCLVALEIFIVSQISATILPPRLSTVQKTIRVKEGQTKVVLECRLDVGDDPISYRWLKQYKLVTADLGFAYRTFHKVHLALHTITLYHEGVYECEAANNAGVNAVSIQVIVEPGDYTTQYKKNQKLPDTSEVLSDLAASLNDVLAEGNCECDVMFLLHASPDAPPQTLSAQANFVHTVAHPIVSDKIRISAMTYSDYVNSKISFGQGTNRCTLSEGLKDLAHEKWSTRIKPVLRDVLKRFRKSKKDCKVLFLPIFGSLGTEEAEPIVAKHLKKVGVKIFIMEVTEAPLPGVETMASQRGDGKPYHWWIPLKIWPTIISYMNYMPEELTGCAVESVDVPGVCVGEGGSCTLSNQCEGIGFGCLQGICQSLECNVKPNLPGCCNEKGNFWCGDVTLSCKDQSDLCDGKIQCMNGMDEDRCWQNPCAHGEARCQSSTLCLSMYDLCDGEPHCPGAEDEDPNFCRSFPCPVDRPFRCRSGKCISNSRLCDGSFRDCADGEDENLEYCAEKHVCPGERPFKCDYGICILERMVCDGAYNCLDALDERLCDERNCPADRPFKCGDGKCVELSLVCNGVVDACMDGLDETNCTDFVCPSERSFKCANGRCIDKWLRCDNRNDCDDNTDEKDCDTPAITSTPISSITTENKLTPQPTRASCKDDQFYCSSGACLSIDKVCDGRRNCISGEDEDRELCKAYLCPPSRSFRCPDGSCVKVAFCDGIPDCSDASDEEDCPDEKTGEGKEETLFEILEDNGNEDGKREKETPEYPTPLENPMPSPRHPTLEIPEDRGTVLEEVGVSGENDEIQSPRHTSGGSSVNPTMCISVLSFLLAWNHFR